MENDSQTTPFRPYDSDRGAGGKFRKPPPRKPPSTPYARPPLPPPGKSQSLHRRWLSKLVIDPAYRLISSGACRILPSIFSQASSTHSMALTAAVEEHAHSQIEAEKDSTADYPNRTSNNEISKTTEVAGPSRAADGSVDQSEIDEYKEVKIEEVPDDIRLSKIEQLLKGKKFSRDEIDRLMEIIQSRAVDLPNPEQGEKLPVPDMTAREAEGPVEGYGIPRACDVEKQEDLDRAIRSTPFRQSPMQDDVGPSPIDIARAYMRGRTSDMGLSSKSVGPKGEMILQIGDESASKSFVPSPSAKSSVCWPGAMVHDRHGYYTPQSQRGRSGLPNFSQTPYSRPLFSKSRFKTQLQGDGNRNSGIFSTPLQHTQTPRYGQVNSRSNALDERYGGSVGPIRRTRNIATTGKSSRGSAYFHSSPTWSSQLEKSTAFEGFMPAAGVKNLEPEGGSGNSPSKRLDTQPSSFEVTPSTVPPKSSQIAKKILEHLDRHPPTPKEKSLELKLATSWKKSLSSDVTSVRPNEHSILRSGGVDSQVGQSSAQQNEGVGIFSMKVQHQGANGYPNTINSHTTSNVNDIAVGTGNAGPSFNIRKTFTTPIERSKEDILKIIPNAGGSKLLNPQNNPPTHSSGVKPNLSAITINKRDPSSGFTFHVSASSSIFSEPPTPSIMPSSTTKAPHESKEGPTDADPLYTFGSKASTPPLVFSFPSTSSTTVPDDTSDIKFSFGSDKKARVSFSSVVKDAICY